MANQMIALQARAPQSAGIGNAIQQNAQMINMLAQQRAAERQAAQAQQKMDLEAQLAGPQLAKAKSDAFAAEQEAFTKFFDVAAKVIGVSKSPEDVLFGADMLKKQYDNPIFAQIIDQTIKDMPTDPQAFGAWRNRTKLETMDAKDQVPYYFEQLKSKEIIGEGGTVGVVTVGGIDRPPTLVVPKTYKLKKPAGGQVDLGEQTTVEGGQGGPDEGMMPMPMTPDEGAMLMAPGDRSSRLSADLASPLMNVKNDAEYQVALQAINRVNPDAAAQIKQIMPRFDPARIEGIRAAAAAEFNVVPQGGQPGLVVGERGGMGGPLEGYVESSTPFRARVPAPPQGPQPRETAEEVFNKELARGRAQNIATAEAPPKKLTAAQEAKLRANITKDYSTAKDTLEYMLHPKTGIVAAVNGVRGLSRSQKEWLVGKTNLLPSITEAGQTADTRWENLVGKATRMGLALARLGGSIGPMAVQEWNIVRNMIASTDPVKMSPQALEEQLDLIEATARGVVERVRDAYENQYAEEFARYPGRFQIPDAQTYVTQKQNELKRGGGRGGSKPGSNIPVLTPAQVRANPKIKRWRTTDGRVMERR